MIETIVQWRKEGRTLQEITKLTYEARERGEDMIYFGWGTKNQGGNSYILPMPVKNQKEYYGFFNKVAEGMISLPANTLYIYEDGRIEFTNKHKAFGVVDKQSLYNQR